MWLFSHHVWVSQGFDAIAYQQMINDCVCISIVFTKLASQLTAEKFTDLAIIPAIFIVMTAVSYGCSYIISRLFRFKKRQANFVTAMAVGFFSISVARNSRS